MEHSPQFYMTPLPPQQQPQLLKHCRSCTCHVEGLSAAEKEEQRKYMMKAISSYTMHRMIDLQIKGARDSVEINAVTSEVFEKFPAAIDDTDMRTGIRNTIVRQAHNYNHRNKLRKQSADVQDFEIFSSADACNEDLEVDDIQVTNSIMAETCMQTDAIEEEDMSFTELLNASETVLQNEQQQGSIFDFVIESQIEEQGTKHEVNNNIPVEIISDKQLGLPIQPCNPSPAVAAIWESSEHMFLGSIGPHIISFNSIRSLKPGQKLTDEIISASISLICGTQKAKNQKIQVADTIVLTNMLVHRKFESGQVRGQKDYVIKIMDEDDAYIWGIVNTGDHWCAVVIDIEKKTLLLLNPLGEKQPQIEAILANWNEYAAKIGIGCFRSIRKDHIIQEDVESCGAIALLLLERIMKGEELTHHTNIDQYRCDLADRIVQATAHFRTKCHVCNTTYQRKVECVVCGRACHTRCVQGDRCTICRILKLDIIGKQTTKEEITNMQPIQLGPLNCFIEGELVLAQYNSAIYLAQCTEEGLVYARTKCASQTEGIKLSKTALHLQKNEIQPIEGILTQFLRGIIPQQFYSLLDNKIIPTCNSVFETLLLQVTYNAE